MTTAYTPDVISTRAHDGRIRKDCPHPRQAAELTELGIFSVMWSEHCSYKSSRLHLKKLPTRSKLVLQGPGENAGIIDIGQGWGIAFKIESHNHPSFIEPFRSGNRRWRHFADIFTMGARPLAMLDALRFGSLEDARAGSATDGSSKAWWPGSRTTATASACPPSAAKPYSRAASTAIRW